MDRSDEGRLRETIETKLSTVRARDAQIEQSRKTIRAARQRINELGLAAGAELRRSDVRQVENLAETIFPLARAVRLVTKGYRAIRELIDGLTSASDAIREHGESSRRVDHLKALIREEMHKIELAEKLILQWQADLIQLNREIDRLKAELKRLRSRGRRYPPK